MRTFCSAVAVLLLGGATEGRAQVNPRDERVLSFRADLTVNGDASLLVVETILVHAAGGAIDHGIYRDLPTRRRAFHFFEQTFPFEIVDVRRDGQPERYTIMADTTGIRVRIGDPSRRLGVGDFAYTLTYRTARQLRFAEDRDELYWNVTGNRWELPIQEASAVIHLPPGAAAPVGPLEAFTGPSGSTARDARVEETAASPVFTTTRPLRRHEGMTIRLGWAKGLVTAPSGARARAAFLRDNGVLFDAAALLTCLFAYLVVSWRRVGRDPRPGPPVVTSQPPDALSPAALRYVIQMSADDTAFAAALISLAGKGHLSIAVDPSGGYTVARQSRRVSNLPPEEQALSDALFARNDVVRLGSAAASPVAAAQAALSKALGAACGERYFTINRRTMRAGLLFSLVVLAVLALSAPGEARAPSAFLIVWLSVWSFAVYALGKAVVQAWRRAAQSRYPAGLVGRAMLGTLLVAPFAGVELVALVGYTALTSGLGALLLTATLATDAALIVLLPRHTVLGRRVLDGAAGYQAFLERTPTGGRAAETAPGSLFAYAVALGAVDRLAGGLTTPMASNPLWWPLSHDPSGGSLSPGAFADAFTSAVSSASSSSGGGSSGGGGGGGGGGGW